MLILVGVWEATYFLWCSASLWLVPKVFVRSGFALPSAGAPSLSHSGKVEDTGVGLPSYFCTARGRAVGVVSASSKVRNSCTSVSIRYGLSIRYGCTRVVHVDGGFCGEE